MAHSNGTILLYRIFFGNYSKILSLLGVKNLIILALRPFGLATLGAFSFFFMNSRSWLVSYKSAFIDSTLVLNKFAIPKF